MFTVPNIISNFHLFHPSTSQISFKILFPTHIKVNAFSFLSPLSMCPALLPFFCFFLSPSKWISFNLWIRLIHSWFFRKFLVFICIFLPNFSHSLLQKICFMKLNFLKDSLNFFFLISHFFSFKFNPFNFFVLMWNNGWSWCFGLSLIFLAELERCWINFLSSSICFHQNDFLSGIKTRLCFQLDGFRDSLKLANRKGTYRNWKE